MRALQSFGGNSASCGGARASAQVFPRPSTSSTRRAAAARPHSSLLCNTQATNARAKDDKARFTLYFVIPQRSSASSAGDSQRQGPTADKSRGWAAAAGVTSFGSGIGYIYGCDITEEDVHDSLYSLSDPQPLLTMPQTTPLSLDSFSNPNKPLQHRQTAASGATVQTVQQTGVRSSSRVTSPLMLAGGLHLAGSNTYTTNPPVGSTSSRDGNSSSSSSSKSLPLRAVLLPSYESDRLAYAVQLQHSPAQPAAQAAQDPLAGSSSSSTPAAAQAPQLLASTAASGQGLAAAAAVVAMATAAAAAAVMQHHSINVAAAAAVPAGASVQAAAIITTTTSSSSSRVTVSDAGSTSNDLASLSDTTLQAGSNTVPRGASGARQFWAAQAAAAARAASERCSNHGKAAASGAGGASVMGAAGFNQSGSSRAKFLTRNCKVTAGRRAACEGNNGCMPHVLGVH